QALAEVGAAGGGLVDLALDLREAVAEVAEDALDELTDRADGLAHRGPAEGGGERGGAADDQVQRGFSPAGFVLERGAETTDGGRGRLERRGDTARRVPGGEHGERLGHVRRERRQDTRGAG